MNKPILNTKSVSITRGPLPGSKKLLVNGVPFREVALSGGEAPVRLYDTSGPYTDESVAHRYREGARGLRAATGFWRAAMSKNMKAAHRKPEDDGLRRGELLSVPQFDRSALKPLRAKPGRNVTQLHYAAPGIYHRGNEIYRGAGKSGPQRARRRQQLWRQYPAGDHARVRAQRNRARPRHHSRPISTIPRPSR